jgi:hypothetical protein
MDFAQTYTEIDAIGCWSSKWVRHLISSFFLNHFFIASHSSFATVGMVAAQPEPMT